MKSPLWITWETQRRNLELASAFGCQYRVYDFSKLPTALRYVLSVGFTTRDIVLSRPERLYVQCPSLVLCTLVALLQFFLRYHLVIDAHNSLFEYLQHRSALVRGLARFSLNCCQAVLVTNQPLLSQLGPWADKGVVLPDRLPMLMGSHSITGEISCALTADCPRPIITLISSFCWDEPIGELIAAFNQLPFPATLFVTGRLEKAGELLRLRTQNVRFTDYLRSEEFDSLLLASDLLVDLTTRENCLVCGAYEALAAGVPILLSDTAALRSLFSGAAIFSKNDTASLLQALSGYFAGPKINSEQLAKAREQFQRNWETAFAKARNA